MLGTKIDTKKTAVLIIDMQNDLLKAKAEPFNMLGKMAQTKGIINNTARVIAKARQAGMPAIFIRNVHKKGNTDVVPSVTDLMLSGLMGPPAELMIEGTPGADIVDELKPNPGDHVINKRRSSAFHATDLELILRSWGIDTLIMTGIVTDGCVANTVRGARERDFHVIVLSDCCATMMPEDDDYFMKKVFPKSGRVRTADEIISSIGSH